MLCLIAVAQVSSGAATPAEGPCPRDLLQGVTQISNSHWLLVERKQCKGMDGSEAVVNSAAELPGQKRGGRAREGSNARKPGKNHTHNKGKPRTENKLLFSINALEGTPLTWFAVYSMREGMQSTAGHPHVTGDIR